MMKNKMLPLALAATLVANLFALLAPSQAQAWDPFISPNRNVEDGNARLRDGDPSGAVAYYDRAARELPAEPRVPLNRGIALLAQGEHEDAQSALRNATSPSAPPEIRGAAYYNLGLSQYQQGDAAAGEEDHQAAQQRFRAAVDSFTRSLRAQPGNRDAAWNLELALRRLREQEQEQQEQEQQEQQDQENQDQQDQENQDQQDQQGDQENQDQQGDQENQDQQDQGEDQQEGDQQDQQQGENEGDQQGENQDEQQGDQGDQENQDDQQQGDQENQDDQEGDQEQEQGEQDQQQGGDQGQDQQQGNQGGGGQQLPQDVERVLDALQDGEENIDRVRARARAARERRRVTRDW